MCYIRVLHTNGDSYTTRTMSYEVYMRSRAHARDVFGDYMRGHGQTAVMIAVVMWILIGWSCEGADERECRE
jgi:hypothetical protein